MRRSPVLKVVEANAALNDPFKEFALSKTQNTIAKLAAKGNTVVEIMRSTGLSRSTVSHHLAIIKRKTICDDYPDGMGRLDLVKYLIGRIEEALE